MNAPEVGATLFVWEDTPPGVWPEGYRAVCVKVSDGKDTGHPIGFQWGANYRKWVERFGQAKVGAWCVAYPQDGEELAHVIELNAPGAPYVILDVEDWQHVTWTDQSVHRIVQGFRSRLRATPLGYSSYPTREQCLAHGINQPLWDGLCDFSVPQVYHPYQREHLTQVLADNRRPHLAVSPNDDPGWKVTASAAMAHGGSVFYWRDGVPHSADWPKQGPPQPAPPAPPAPTGDPLRPPPGQFTATGPFIAWDGGGWYMTDMIWRRALPLGTVKTLHARGVRVIGWHEVTACTAPVPPA